VTPTPRVPWLQTYSGRAFPFPPDPAAVCVHDIAHALANTCRFSGHPRRFYSVAEHSVRVALHLQGVGFPPCVVLAGLVHDASEAYLNDIPSPLKALHEFAAYRTLERAVQATIEEALGVWVTPSSPAVRVADHILLSYEAVTLLGPAPSGWEWGWDVVEAADAIHPDAARGELGWTPGEAEGAWLGHLAYLRSAGVGR
jgi:uncharacterized protein